jgi:Cof subfamily protein (haloacid dehalogenase superfamily)
LASEMLPEVKALSLVAVDLDGTLLTIENTLAPEGARLLKQAARAGVHVVLATTRNPDSVLSFCRALEINDPLICANGAQVWGSPTGPVWAYRSIPTEAALTIARLADAHNWELSTTVGSMTYWRRRPGQALGPFALNVTIVATNSDAIVGDPVRILVHQPQAVEEIQALCHSQLAEQCYAEVYYKRDGSIHSLGVFALGANKGAALALVLERLGIEQEDVMAIGDNPNDVPMFSFARVRVAMADAPAEVKRNATAVAPTNNQEGVAWALRRFVL